MNTELAKGNFLDAALTMSAINAHMLKFRAGYLDKSMYVNRRYKMRAIIMHGWECGFNPAQTAIECMLAGFSFSVCIPEIKRIWRDEDRKYHEYCEANKHDAGAPFGFVPQH